MVGRNAKIMSIRLDCRADLAILVVNMRSTQRMRSIGWLGLGIVLVLGGCATDGGVKLVPSAAMRVNARGQIADTGFVAQDLVVACYNIQRAMQGVPDVTSQPGPVKIAVESVVNDPRLPVDVATFNAALRGQLRANASPQLNYFAAENDTVPHFYLANRLQRLRADPPLNHEVMVYTFQLIDARNSEMVMEGSYEIRNYTLSLPISP